MPEKRILKAALVYLTQEGGGFFVTDNISPEVQNRPKLGLQYLCAVLESIGVKTDIFDQAVSDFNAKGLIEKLKGYDLAGFYCSDSQEQKVKAYCREIRAALEIIILVGGPNTLENATFLDYGCDIVVHGEGEKTIRDIVRHYNADLRLEEIKGISYKKDGILCQNDAQELINDLDQLPFPDRSKIDINAYFDFFIFSMRKPYVTMIASRGCVYRCHFCTSCKLWGYRYRTRSVSNVISEIEEIVRSYGVRYIAFQDDVFGVSVEWTEEFCLKLLEKRLNVKWMVILHPFSMQKKQREILGLMKRAGCDTLSFGVQSEVPEMLEAVNRDPLEPERLKQILSCANSLGFLSQVCFIFGLPGDTRESIQRTIDYSLHCGTVLANYFTLSMLKGSELERMYQGKTICEIPQDELRRLATMASRKFYTHPKNILRISSFILKNPRWLGNVGLKLPSVLSRIGLYD